MRLSSPAFADGAAIPRRHTCDGAGLSPPLEWKDAPAGTLGFALICDDPDAPGGVWAHWAAYDIPPDRAGLPEGVGPADRRLGVKQAINDFGGRGFGAPCPPHGHGAHRYRFKLYALSAAHLQLASGAKVADVEREARRAALAEASLVGLYARAGRAAR